jgi:hypothetical protein
MLAWHPRRARRARVRAHAPVRAGAVSRVSRSMSAPFAWRFAAAGCPATPPRRGRGGGGVAPRRRWSPSASSARRSRADGSDRDAPFAGIRANVRSALDLFRNTVEAGGAARVSFDRTVKDTPGYAARGLVLDALEKITGLPVAIEGTLRLYPDGVVINRLTVGEDMTVDKLLVRAKLQPLLAVLDAWKTDPAAAAELRVDSIRARGVNLDRAHFDGVRRAYDIYRAAPGPIIISKLKLYDLCLDVAPHDPYEGRDAPPARRFLRLAALELARLDSRAPVADLASSVVKVDELGQDAVARETAGVYENIRGVVERRSTTRPTAAGWSTPGDTDANARPGPSTSTSSSSSSSSDPRGSSLDPFASFRAFVPAPLMWQVDRAVSPEVIALANASWAVMETAAPAAAAQLAAFLADGGAGASELARAGGTGEVMLDVGLVTALLTAGLPRRFLADGGALMVKLVESGVGAELLRRGDVLRALVERRMIDRLLDLDLMEALLDRPELTKAMFRSGVVRGVLSNGVLEALLAAGKEEVCVSILRGPMIEILMDTGMLPAMMTSDAGGAKRKTTETRASNRRAKG